MGLGLPEVLALGAATGTPQARSTRRATGCEGMRTATLGRPALTTSGTQGFLGMRSVSGPGQKRSISARAAGLMRHSGTASSGAGTCTMSGLSAGRPLAAKMARTAASSSALAPRP